MYPKIQDELYDWPVRCVGAGSSWIMVGAENACIAWGSPVAGKFGLEGDARQSIAPKFVEKVRGLIPVDISCGYGHCCTVFQLPEREDNGSELAGLLDSLPVIDLPLDTASSSNDKKKGKKKSIEVEDSGSRKKSKK